MIKVTLLLLILINFANAKIFLINSEKKLDMFLSNINKTKNVENTVILEKFKFTKLIDISKITKKKYIINLLNKNGELLNKTYLENILNDINHLINPTLNKTKNNLNIKQPIKIVNKKESLNIKLPNDDLQLKNNTQKFIKNNHLNNKSNIKKKKKKEKIIIKLDKDILDLKNLKDNFKLDKIKIISLNNNKNINKQNNLKKKLPIKKIVKKETIKYTLPKDILQLKNNNNFKLNIYKKDNLNSKIKNNNILDIKKPINIIDKNDFSTLYAILNSNDKIINNNNPTKINYNIEKKINNFNESTNLKNNNNNNNNNNNKRLTNMKDLIKNIIKTSPLIKKSRVKLSDYNKLINKEKKDKMEINNPFKKNKKIILYKLNKENYSEKELLSLLSNTKNIETKLSIFKIFRPIKKDNIYNKLNKEYQKLKYKLNINQKIICLNTLLLYQDNLNELKKLGNFILNNQKNINKKELIVSYKILGLI